MFFQTIAPTVERGWMGTRMMRCDCCPLRPLAEDDVCPECEGEYGIEQRIYGRMLGVLRNR